MPLLIVVYNMENIKELAKLLKCSTRDFSGIYSEKDSFVHSELSILQMIGTDIFKAGMVIHSFQKAGSKMKHTRGQPIRPQGWW